MLYGIKKWLSVMSVVFFTLTLFACKSEGVYEPTVKLTEIHISPGSSSLAVGTNKRATDCSRSL